MCTSIIAGRKAVSGDGIMIARDEDFDVNNWNKYLKPLRSPQYITDVNCIEGDAWRLGNGMRVPIPQKALRYCSSPDAAGSSEAVSSVGDHYFFEERGFNEKNVMMSATNSMEINAKADAADPAAGAGIEESIILTLILPQAESALEAVQLLGRYVEQYGAVEANGIAVADQKEVWYMEIGSAHHWAAVRVPQECYLAVSNCMRIRGIDLEDTENVQCSRRIYDFVKEEGLLADPDKHNFDFASAFGYYGKSGAEPDLYYNVDRLWLIQHLLTPSLEQDIRQEEYPLFLKPDQKITVIMAANVLRAGYEGTALEHVSKRPIGVVRTAESHIMVMNDSTPEGFGSVIWQTVGTPLGCPYMPLYPFMEHIPDVYALGGSVYDEDSAYWKFRSLFSIAACMGAEESAEIRGMWNDYEEELFRQFEYVQRSLKEIGKEDAAIAGKAAENYSTGILLQAAQMAQEKRAELLTRMSQAVK